MPRLLLLALLAASCSKHPQHWWEARNACPEGATLRGEPKPDSVPVSAPRTEPLPPEEKQSYLDAWQVYCAIEEPPGRPQRHGRATAWYGNGQMNSELLWEQGRIVRLSAWDELGRRTMDYDCSPAGDQQPCEGTATYWHEDGVKAMEGGLRKRKRHGQWSEWDEQGQLIGQVVFEDGQPGPMTVSSSRFLVEHSFFEADLFVASDDVELPSSASRGSPRLAVNLVVGQERLSVDGVALLRLSPQADGAAAISATEKRGQLVMRLYDSLAEKMESTKLIAQASGQEIDRRLLIQADRDLTYAVLREVLYTAGQAQFDRFLLLVSNPAFQLPPRSGPERLQGQRLPRAVEVELPVIGPPQIVDGQLVWPNEPSLRISGQGYALVEGDATQVIPCLQQGCPDAESYDAATLNKALAAARQTQPDARHLIVAPSSEIPYQVIVHALDAAREDSAQLDEEGRPLALFPRVVLAGGAD